MASEGTQESVLEASERTEAGEEDPREPNIQAEKSSTAAGDSAATVAAGLQDFVAKVKATWLQSGESSNNKDDDNADNNKDASECSTNIEAKKSCEDNNEQDKEDDGTEIEIGTSFWAKLSNPDKWSAMAERAGQRSLFSFNGDDNGADNKIEAALWSMKLGEKKEDNFFLLIGKLKLTLDHAQELLGKEMSLTAPQALRAMSFLMGCCETYIGEHPEVIREMAEKDGAEKAKQDILLDVDQYMEFANAAYDEFDPDETIYEFFARRDYTLVYYDPATDYELAAHYVAFQPDKKICIVGIKGTSTIGDVLTDILCRSTPFISDKMFAHDGIKITAQRVAARVQSFLLNLFVPLDYEIIFTGHSLGAGVAALVAVIFREAHQIKKVRALAYACPPVLDKEAALGTYDYITSVVSNHDIIPRTSLSNMNIMSEALKRVNKRLEGSEQEISEDSNAQGAELLRELYDLQEEYKLAYDQDLYVPGRLLYIFAPDQSQRFAVEKDGVLSNLRHMLFTRSMVMDHSMDNYIIEIRNALFDLYKLHSVTSPALIPDTPGATVTVPDHVTVFSKEDNCEIVYYHILTIVARGPEHVKEYHAYRRFTDFDKLSEVVREAELQLTTSLPSKITTRDPKARAKQFEAYLTALIYKATHKRLQKIRDALRDFVGMGDTPSAPDFVLQAVHAANCY
mmetsp:Transcript_3052/g.4959  ORF Transcript_3052/g.4959 Transcript_3052/m.4959 type:complete len:683 (+) Transcript_3052:36-2084(+)